MFKYLSRHPPELRTFFATEMWERYGFYVVQSLLAIQLTVRFGWTDEAIYTLVSAFTGLTYLSPMLGGYIADTWIGQKKTIIIGGLCLCGSYMALAFMQTDLYLCLALTGIAVGTGLLKPNVSSLLGHIYTHHPTERENGFTIFYMGITTGIILGTTLPSYLQRLWGWPVVFVSAAFGMVIALCVFCIGVKTHRIQDYQENRIPSRFCLLKALGFMLIIFGGCYGVLKNALFGQIIFLMVLITSIVFIARSMKKEHQSQAAKTMVIGLLCLISVLYWAFYFQMFLSLTLFIMRLVQPTLGGFQMPPPYYVSVESFGMIVFGYFISKQRIKLSTTQIARRATNKFFIAMVSITLSYAIVIGGILCTADTHFISPLWMMAAYLCVSLSELLLSPVGLSIVTLLADRKRVSTLMGIFFVSLSLGAYLAGFLAKTTAIDPTMTSGLMTKLHYLQGFKLLLWILIGAVLLSGVIAAIIRGRYLVLFDEQASTKPA